MISHVIAHSDNLLEYLDENGITVFLKDRDGHYLYINETGAKILGKDLSEILHKTDVELFDPTSGELVRNRDLEALSRRDPKIYDLVVQVKGRWSHYHDAKAALREGDQILGIVGVSVERTTPRDRTKEALAIDALGRILAAPRRYFQKYLNPRVAAAPVASVTPSVAPLESAPPERLPVGGIAN